MTTVGLILIGNELLTGKIRDENGYELARFCFARGATLTTICIVPDETAVIAEAVNRIRQHVDVLITSGGVGPTHDDITYDAIASAFGVKCIPFEPLINRIQSYFGSKVTDAHLKMGYLPSNATLHFPAQSQWPTVSVENVHIFPGVPHIFRAKLNSIKEKLKGTKHHLAILELLGDEGTIAEVLKSCEAEFNVTIGCYPVFEDPKFNIRVTIESVNESHLNQAVNRLTTELTELVSHVRLAASPV
ncbi:MAG: competence/damage-inducible protein A [Bradymonadia bacterium]